jgi:hypothetical protein
VSSPKPFDTYEVVGIIVPGVIGTLVIASEVPQFAILLSGQSISVGDLGLFLVISFVVGHLTQSLGNVVEFGVWLTGGLPTNHVLSPDQRLISGDQRKSLIQKVQGMEDGDRELEAYSREEWRAVTTRAYLHVKNAGRSSRIDSANRTYGLFRGLAASFVGTSSWYGIQIQNQPELFGVSIFALAASIWRMRRAGVHYARALFQEFIDLPEEPGVKG